MRGADGAAGDVGRAFVDAGVFVREGPEGVDLVPVCVEGSAFKSEADDDGYGVAGNVGHVDPDGPFEPWANLADAAVEAQDGDFGQACTEHVEQRHRECYL